mmetsp:Transcript_27670/g.63433  ORF Transcript_27670/g.63433 Transcript_27670/m.63433 type:complete len:88 (+) Transcript_27670:366-629(+)
MICSDDKSHSNDAEVAATKIGVTMGQIKSICAMSRVSYESAPQGNNDKNREDVTMTKNDNDDSKKENSNDQYRAAALSIQSILKRHK